MGKTRRGYLHIGSGVPDMGKRVGIANDLRRGRRGRHALVDPLLATTPQLKKLALRVNHPRFNLDPRRAHASLDEQIANGMTYHTVRMDMPNKKLIGKAADFRGLSRKVGQVLNKNGTFVILTDSEPRGGRGWEDIHSSLEDAGLKVQTSSRTRNPQVLARSQAALEADEVSRMTESDIPLYLIVAKKT